MKKKVSVIQRTLGQSLIKGLKEAVAFENKKIDLRTVTIEVPDAPPEFSKTEVKEVREHLLNVSQPVFAKILGVSDGTVKAWESGTNTPSGSSARLIQMAMQDPQKFKEIMQSLAG